MRETYTLGMQEEPLLCEHVLSEVVCGKTFVAALIDDSRTLETRHPLQNQLHSVQGFFDVKFTFTIG